jgi:hypothetical protein
VNLTQNFTTISNLELIAHREPNVILQKNGTLQERLRLKRGIQNVDVVGRVVAYKEQPRMAVWNGPRCNEFSGTDGSIFPPFLQDAASVAAYAPDLCR